MELRILIEQNNPTVAEIKKHRENTGFGLQTCLEVLRNRTETLQYYSEKDKKWFDVSVVQVIRSSNTN